MPVVRFVSGAICPKCHLIDKLRLKKLPEKQIIDCVNCGYTSTQDSISRPKDLSKEK